LFIDGNTGERSCVCVLDREPRREGEKLRMWVVWGRIRKKKVVEVKEGPGLVDALLKTVCMDIV
jgi:hypothetical protein